MVYNRQGMVRKQAEYTPHVAWSEMVTRSLNLTSSENILVPPRFYLYHIENHVQKMWRREAAYQSQ